MMLNSEKGASLVEFTLILPLLLLLVFGIIEFGLLMYNKAMLTNASREGARAAIVFRNDTVTDTLDRRSIDEISDIVNNYCENYLVTFGSPSDPIVDVAAYEMNDATKDPSVLPTLESGKYITVEVEYRYDFLLVPAFVSSMGGGLNLLAITSMRAE